GGGISVDHETRKICAILEIDGERSGLSGSLEEVEKLINKNGGGDALTVLTEYMRPTAEEKAEAEAENAEWEAEERIASYVNDILTGRLTPQQYKKSKKWCLPLGSTAIEFEEPPNYDTLELAELAKETLEEEWREERALLKSEPIEPAEKEAAKGEPETNPKRPDFAPPHICVHCHLDPPDGSQRQSAYNDEWLHPRCEKAFINARLAEEGLLKDAPRGESGNEPDRPTFPEPDRNQLEIFIDALFRYCDLSGVVSLRSFCRDTGKVFIESVP